jgi:hypothetical protein
MLKERYLASELEKTPIEVTERRARARIVE